MNEEKAVLIRLLFTPPSDAKGDKSDTAVSRGKELGLVSNEIDVSKPASRIEAVSMIGRALGIKPSDDPLPFTDLSNYTIEERRMLAALYKAGLIQGTSDTTFTPDRVLSRAELAILVERVLRKYR